MYLRANEYVYRHNFNRQTDEDTINPLFNEIVSRLELEDVIDKNGFAGLSFVISIVETKAQFCNAAEFLCSLIRGVPIIHSPRPGGVHFKLNKRSNASLAEAAALESDQGSR